MGSERVGVSDEAIELADELITIPMTGMVIFFSEYISFATLSMACCFLGFTLQDMTSRTLFVDVSPPL